MPKTTTPVNEIDPNIPAGFNINEIKLIGLSNLPPGLSFEANQSVYDPSSETDGCLKICGTPLQAGLYIVEVTVEATIIVITQQATFPIEIYIAPSTSINDGFTLTNTSGCGEVTVSFENNVPSNGNPGFAYQWDFGNGFSTTDENPQDQTYTEAGDYVVNYEAIIDTVGYVLTKVTITEVSCDDIPTAPDWSFNPDMHVQVIDPDGNVIYDSDTFWNTDPPIEVAPNIILQAGTYEIKAIDEDSGINGADDICANVPFNQLSNGSISIGDFSVELEIIHPVDTIQSADTVQVFEIPDDPQISINDPVELCVGGSAILFSSYDEGNQWFLNSEPIENATEIDLEVTVSGIYAVEYTSPEGCTAYSAEYEVTFTDNPPVPEYFNVNNLLTLDESIDLPSNFELQWYQDGIELTGENDVFYCAMEDGEYTLQVTDLVTGCMSTYTEAISFDQDLACFNAVDNLSEELNLKIFPNPALNELNISFENLNGEAITISIYSLLGKRYNHETLGPQSNGLIQKTVDLSGLPSGLHLLEINSGDMRITRKFVKQ